jgi:hypothetical protein
MIIVRVLSQTNVRTAAHIQTMIQRDRGESWRMEDCLPLDLCQLTACDLSQSSLVNNDRWDVSCFNVKAQIQHKKELL